MLLNEAHTKFLNDTLAQFGIAISADSRESIFRHLELVSEWNQMMNLTSITDRLEMIVKHTIDSAILLSVMDVKPGMLVLDVGSGAGFPGVVLKCLYPPVDLVLIESSQKKCKFLEALRERMDTGVLRHGRYEVVWGRAEELGQAAPYRQRFDVVVARAVAELRVLSELCLPFCRIGGSFIAMKGPNALEEIALAQRAIDVVGGAVMETKEIVLPMNAGTRVLVCIRKIKETPQKYPRRAGIPNRNPL